MRADQVPTPAYVYDLAEIRRSHALLAAALPTPSVVHYSLKANPHPDVLTALRGLGVRAEVCSTGELDAALATGWAPDEIIYGGPGKRDAEVAQALASGVREFSVDSPAAIDQLDRTGTGTRCLLRVNDDQPVPGHGLVMTGVTSQFGADLGWIEAQPDLFASREHARVTGLHLYMGTNIGGTQALLGQFAQALNTAVRLRKVLRTEFDVLNLGGGFGAPFARDGDLPRFTGLAEGLAALLDDSFPGWREGGPRIVFESGRYLTATCGQLLVRVLDVKESHGRRVVVLESGINHLGGMSGLRRLPVITPALHAADAGPVSPALVTGPLCTPLDVWARGAEIPPVAPGDVLTVPNVGAYGLTASLVAFLGHDLPTEVVLDDGQFRSESRLALHRRPATIT
ncbi:type III PLP-dependent enzyme [Streptomyces olivaceus]|uniref:type III PLP-dependent enzyme n=1 Tax=Streptomyces olivaceus TaxID=47716 RepID=UPI0036414BA1